jgi:pimeloyl-ACP methyl ester carboxylesterase
MEGKRMRMAGWIHRVVAMLVVAASPAFAETPVGVDLTAPGPNAPLHGTLLNAGKGTPVVLIIPGSGPTDRDGNNPYGVRAKTYRLMAEALAVKGISSVRIDKRGMFASKPAIADGNAVRIADYADDVRSWVKAAQTATGARCVWLLGHSEGGLVVLAAGDASNIGIRQALRYVDPRSDPRQSGQCDHL